MSSEEPHIIAALADLLRQHDIKWLVHVGAEDGHEANEIRKELGCRVTCIDPDPKCGPVSHELEWHEVLIGDTEEVVDFFLHSSSGLSSKFARRDSNETLARLPQQLLERFCRKHGIKPDALIIDCEGATLDVLRGCGAMLSLIKVIYAEVSHDKMRIDHAGADEVDAYLVERGFTRSMELPTYCAGMQSNWTWTR